MTMIVKSSALKDVSGTAFCSGSPLTGVVLSIERGLVSERIVYSEGRRIGAYVNQYFFYDSQLHVDADALDFQESEPYVEPYSYQGKPFNGTAYRFEGDRCWLEMQCEAGFLLSSVKHNASGGLDEVIVAEGDDFLQHITWFENGELKILTVSERDRFRFSMALDRDGRLRTLSIDGDYFQRVRELGERLRFHMFEEIDSFEKLSGADYLYIAGSAVDDDMFAILSDRGQLQDTLRLRVYGARLSGKSLVKLVPYMELKEIVFQSPLLSVQDVERFRALRPDCTLEVG